MMNYMPALSIDDITYTLPEEPSVVSLRDIFNSDRPVELEIGTGKGGFLLEQAKAHEDRNYLGLEWANKYYRFAANRMARWSMKNVRMIRADAKIFVIRCLPPRSLAAVHAYHPDPWPKKRHHKRRLFDTPFVEALTRVLEDAGRLSVQTDHEAYFQVIDELLSSRGELEQTLRYAKNDPGHEQLVATNYQIKYTREDRRFYRLEFKRLPRNATQGDEHRS
jgi:tRNA (guanine-N7-)-methyltransferase